MNNYIKIFSLSLAILFSMQLSAQKFGYINTQELIKDIPEVKEANSNLETFKKQLQKLGQEKVKNLQTKYQSLQRRQSEGAIAPVQLETESAKLKEEEAEIMEFEKSSQEKIVKKSEQLLAPLREKIQKAIDDVAAENGYDYIFDYSVGIILYAEDSTNVSAMVKAKLGI